MKKLLVFILAVLALNSQAEPMPFTDYETVAASQSDQVIGPVGGSGDVLSVLVVSVATAATGTVSIKDGSGSAIPITAANTPIGVYTIILNARSTGGAWKVTTGAGATAVAVGRFK